MKEIKTELLEKSIDLRDFCKKYNIELSALPESLEYNDIDDYTYGTGLTNGKDMFFVTDGGYSCTIIKLTGDKYVLTTYNQNFPSEVLPEYHLDNDIVLSFEANEDFSLDFLFEFSTERSEGFEKIEF